MSEEAKGAAPIGLRIQKDAPWWVASVGRPEDAGSDVEIARIHLAVAQRPEIYEGFKALMISVVQAELTDIGYGDLTAEAITVPTPE